MFDLLKGRGYRELNSRDALIYLFNMLSFVGLNPTAHCRLLYYFYGSIITLFVVVLSPLIFNIGWIRDRNVLSIMEILNCVQAALNVIGVPIKSIALMLCLDRIHSVEPLLLKLDAHYSKWDDMLRIRQCAIMGNRLVFSYIVPYMMYETLTVVSAVLGGHAPLTLWLPYVDWHRSSREYWLQVCFDAITLFYLLCHQIINDSYPAVYIYIVRTHVQLLERRVSRLGYVPQKSEHENCQELQECIVTHQEILRLVHTIQPIISITMFVQFIIAAAIMSITMINIFIFADLATRLASFVYLICVVLQTAPSCHQASYLQGDCEKLSSSIFHCNWIAQDKQFKKLLIYFLQRSQADMPLIALKMLPINLATNVSIAKFSFSLYTFIQKMGLGAHLND
ncbi:odorant receptor 7a-like [Ceratitis capitata]|uniref:odorant receptor 7a-like n=1 Tax=Ceratitis capitata TaxID=7213 RepID=UPI000618964F|nr:odorant receptor 7a-like [Ceratitis capitata]